MHYGHAFAICRFSSHFGPEYREDRVEANSLRRAGRRNLRDQEKFVQKSTRADSNPLTLTTLDIESAG